MQFEWDEVKREANLHTHGFDFVEAAKAFEGIYFEGLDTRKEYNEDRYILYGVISGVVVNLVYTRREEKIRVISLRRANKRERGRYEETIRNRLGAGQEHE